MELFLIRHAEAVDFARSEAERSLTSEGRERFQASVRGLASLGIAFDAIWHSPYMRAAQTAQICGELSSSAPQPCDELLQAPSQLLLKKLQGVEGCLALVGHEPWMSELYARLTTGDPAHATGLPFGKGAVAWLRGSPAWRGMDLCGFIPPGVSRGLAAKSTSKDRR